MERLTIRNSDGSVSQPTDLKWAEALEKLAAYEDTGLEPEEIEHRLKNERHWATIWMAEADDRLLVLPCRFGSDIYTIVTTDRSRGARACPHPVRHIRYGTLTWNNLRNVLDGFGKSVFLTREEAEAALNGGNDG